MRQPPEAMSHLPAGVPLLDLNDARRLPQLGFGVWQVPNEKVTPAVATALEAGYRAVDTAQGYDNEAGVGAALAASGIPREQLYVTSKLRTKLLGYDDAMRGIDLSLKALQLDYLDLFLIHWPAPARDLYVKTWKAFVGMKEQGLVRSIGVSNFLPEHIDRLIAETGVVPAVNQIEIHPEFQQRDVRAYHASNHIQLESYSPLGSGAVLDNPVVGDIARRLGRSPAQVIIRWHIQEGLAVIPKSVTPERIRQNLAVFDFALDDADMGKIAGLDRPDGKTNGDPATFNDLF
jgi:2,5-diketo-D-gluconate reductase A